MKRTITTTILAALLLSSFSCAEDPEIGKPNANLKIDAGPLVKSVPGLFDGIVKLTPKGTGTIDSLFTNTATVELKAKVTGRWDDAEKNTFVFRGVYTDGKIEIPFRRVITPAANGNFDVSETADFTKLSGDYSVAEYSLVLGLNVTTNEHNRLLAFGGKGRAEMFRMDMNDRPMRTLNLSDGRAFRPYWDIGGITALRRSFRIWKANHADTMAYPLEDKSGDDAYWADYSELDKGLRIEIERPTD